MKFTASTCLCTPKLFHTFIMSVSSCLFSVSSPFSLWSTAFILIFSASFSRGGPWSEVCVFTFINFIFESSLLYSLIVTVLHSLLCLKVFLVSSLCLKVLHSLLLSFLQVSLFEFDLNDWNVNISFAFFFLFILWNRFRYTFQEKAKWISKSVWKKTWNFMKRILESDSYFLKRITYSISGKKNLKFVKRNL